MFLLKFIFDKISSIWSESRVPLFNYWHLKQFGNNEILGVVELSKLLSVISALLYYSRTKLRCFVDGLYYLLYYLFAEPILTSHSSN